MPQALPLKAHLIWATLTLVIVSLLGAEPIFKDATKSLNLGIGGGQVAWGDFNNDGWEDLHDGSLWINERGKKFSRFTGEGPSSHGMMAGWIFIHGQAVNCIAMSRVKNLKTSLQRHWMSAQ